MQVTHRVSTKTMQQINADILQEVTALDAGALSHLLNCLKPAVLTSQDEDWQNLLMDTYLQLVAISGMLKVRQQVEPLIFKTDEQ